MTSVTPNSTWSRQIFLTLSYYTVDISKPDFPGIYSFQNAYTGPRPNTTTHPNLQLEKTMVSVPKVNPGDMVFWHCVGSLLSLAQHDIELFITLLMTGCDPCGGV